MKDEPGKNGMLLLIILILALSLPLSLPFSLAITTFEETATPSRIVGESPTEMLRQMQRGGLDISEAAYFSYETGKNKKLELLKEQFGEVESNLETGGYTFYDVHNAARDLSKNELFIIEAYGWPTPLSAYTGQVPYWLGSDPLFPKDLVKWQESIEQKNPLFFFESLYGGLYLPKQDSFVSRTVRDATVIAPMLYNTPQFTKSFICMLWDGETVGEAFQNARNFHYNGGSITREGNYLGLILQSYALFGNPMQSINMDWGFMDFYAIKDKFCKNNLENLETGIEYLGQEGNYSKFRKHIRFQIDEHSIIGEGNFSIINVSDGFQREIFGEPVLPMAVRTTFFPKNTILINISVLSVADSAGLDIPAPPSYEEDYTNRTCYEEYENYSITFGGAYTKDALEVVAEIHPVEIINCTEGKFRIYKTFDYFIDYLAVSPVLIKDVQSPPKAAISQKINISVELKKLTDGAVNGSIAIFDQSNNKLLETEIGNVIPAINLSFTAPPREGIQKYSAEFIQDNRTVAYRPFSVDVAILEVGSEIPVTALQDTSINLTFESFYDSQFPLDAKYALQEGNAIIADGQFSMQIAKGTTKKSLSFTGLNRTDQSYTLTIQLSYLDQQKVETFLIVTNNVPLIQAHFNRTAREDEIMALNIDALDLDNDSLTVSINDTRLEKVNGSYEWDTDFGDAGQYAIEITAADGVVASTQVQSFIIEPFPNARLIDFFDGNRKGISINVSPQSPGYLWMRLPKAASLLSAKLFISQDLNAAPIPEFASSNSRAYSTKNIDNETFFIRVEDKSSQYLNTTFFEDIVCLATLCPSSCSDEIAYSVYINGQKACDKSICTFDNCGQNISINYGSIAAGLNSITVYQRKPACCESTQIFDQIRLENPRSYVLGSSSFPDVGISFDALNDSSLDSSYNGPLNNTPIKAFLNVTAIQDFLRNCPRSANATCLVPIKVESSTSNTLSVSPYVVYLPGEALSTTLNISLREGWNMVSFPFELAIEDLSQGPFSTVPENCTRKLARYNTSKKQYEMAKKNGSGWKSIDNLTALDESAGYFVMAWEDCSLLVELGGQQQKKIFLEEGWNLIPYPSETVRSPKEVFSNVTGQFISVFTLENKAWLSYSPLKPSSLNSLEIMGPGQSYWVNINASDAAWEFDEGKGMFIRQ